MIVVCLSLPPLRESYRIPLTIAQTDPLAAATLAQTDPNGGSERTNNIRNNPSSEILILIDAKEDTISSATPRTLTSGVISNEETTTEKTEPRKLGEVRFEDMF